MLPFGVTIPATVPQGSEIPEGLMNNPVYSEARMEIYAENKSKVITFTEWP
jgi:hypothetical protein